MTKYIYHHLGLGDHIICNGLVRFFQEIEKEIYLFCKKNNLHNVEYMYRDNDKIKILPINDDNEVLKFIKEKKIENKLIKIGFEDLQKHPCKTFDESFYKSKNLDFEIRFNNFFLERDFDLENQILNTLNPKKEKYIFLHNVDKNKVRNDLKIIENPSEYSIFNLISLIENAEEVHLMESSIKCLVNSYLMKNPKFFYHRYVRKYSEYFNTKGLNKFEIID